MAKIKISFKVEQREWADLRALAIHERLNGWKISVDSNAAYAFLMERIATGTANYEYLLPWIRSALIKIES